MMVGKSGAEKVNILDKDLSKAVELNDWSKLPCQASQAKVSW